MFDTIKQKQKRVSKIDEHSILEKILDSKYIKGKIIDLNQKQLYEKGIQADGSPTGEYHFITIGYKLEKGDSWNMPGRTDHITGNDTGITYKSMNVTSLPTGIVINADDRNNFFVQVPLGLGLTEESLDELIPLVKIKFLEKVTAAL